jgi:hypothetical protein
VVFSFVSVDPRAIFVHLTLDALGYIADCLIPGSPGMPGNPGQYSDPYPTNAVTVPPRSPIDPAHTDAGQFALFPNTTAVPVPA